MPSSPLRNWESGGIKAKGPVDGHKIELSQTTIAFSEQEDGASSIGRGRPFPSAAALGDRSAHVVDFDGPQDPLHPHNWPARKKLQIASLLSLATLISTLSSALFAPATNTISAHFSLAPQTTLLGTSLYILGFALGPLLFAPASELIGRRTPLLVGMLGSSIFSLAAGSAKDAPTLLIARFFAGAFGASPLCLGPAVLADMYPDRHRGTAISVYALTIFAGPFAGPCIGGFIVADPLLGWRWTQYLPAILGAVNLISMLFFLDETSAAMILVRKAGRLRAETGLWSLHAEQQRLEPDWRAIGQKYFLCPLRLLVQEPIVLLILVYISFVYALLYALMMGYPYVFAEVRGMKPGVSGLPFLALLIGQVLGLCLIIWLESRNRPRVDVEKPAIDPENRGVVPEARLPAAIIGAPVFRVEMFWFAWTAAAPNVHWIIPVTSGIAIGFGLFCVYSPCFNYLVDAFTPIAASTVAANVMLRSATAASFPLFARQMFENLGVQWAGTLMGCFLAAMIPIPALFSMYGPRLRRKSRALARELKLEEAGGSARITGPDQYLKEITFSVARTTPVIMFRRH